MKNILIFDVDGTLYDNKNNEVPESTIEAIRQLHGNKDNILIMATGRNLDQLADVLSKFDSVFDYKVLINGQLAMKHNYVVSSTPMQVDVLKRLDNLLEERKLPAGYVGLRERRMTKVNDDVVEGLKYVQTPVPEIGTNFHIDNDIYQVWMFGGEEDAKCVENEFADLKCVRWYPRGYDILPKKVSKVNGIKKVLELLNINEKTIYAFGDGDNDIEMIQFADYGISMGNGTSKLKDIADYVTENVNNNGIKKALEHFGLIEK